MNVRSVNLIVHVINQILPLKALQLSHAVHAAGRGAGGETDKDPHTPYPERGKSGS